MKNGLIRMDEAVLRGKKKKPEKFPDSMKKPT